MVRSLLQTPTACIEGPGFRSYLVHFIPSLQLMYPLGSNTRQPHFPWEATHDCHTQEEAGRGPDPWLYPDSRYLGHAPVGRRLLSIHHSIFQTEEEIFKKFNQTHIYFSHYYTLNIWVKLCTKFKIVAVTCSALKNKFTVYYRLLKKFHSYHHPSSKRALPSTQKCTKKKKERD